MVSIQSRQIIIPSSPTPSTKLYSLCEQIKLPTHEHILYVFKPHNNDKNNTSPTFIQTLRNSLRQALVIYYPLAGRLNWIKGGRWELHCNAKGAHLLEAKGQEIEKLEDLGDFVSTPLVSQLMSNIDYNLIPIEEIPLLSVQLTMFRCGGFTLGVSLCPGAIDGISAMRFMDTWAKLARGEPLNPIEMPCHDRTILDSHKQSNSAFLHPHFEFHAPPLWVGDLENTSTTLIAASVKLTREQVAKLKKKATLLKRAKPNSTFEVVTGHLWRCVSKARYVGNGDQQTRLSTVVNCRNRLRPPLPSTYAGNVVFPTVTSKCSFHELMNKPLSYAVENVREALEKVTGEFVSSTLDYIEREKDMHLLRDIIYYPAKKDVSECVGTYKGDPNLFVISWMNFSYKDVDFGWGKPVYFGPGYLHYEGCAYIMSDTDGDGVFIVICLEASHMDSFKKLFYDDIEVVFHTSKL